MWKDKAAAKRQIASDTRSANKLTKRAIKQEKNAIRLMQQAHASKNPSTHAAKLRQAKSQTRRAEQARWSAEKLAARAAKTRKEIR